MASGSSPATSCRRATRRWSARRRWSSPPKSSRFADAREREMGMPEPKPRSPYDSQAEYWNSAATRPWAEQYERMDRALAGLADALLEAAAPQPGECALDIGCGSGTTVLELARRVGPTGRIVGADIAEHSAAEASARVAAAGLRNVEVICADVATHPFAAGSIDLAFSRLGVM